MRTSDFDYALPEELIAQEPIEPRDAARLLVVQRGDGGSNTAPSWTCPSSRAGRPADREPLARAARARTRHAARRRTRRSAAAAPTGRGTLAGAGASRAPAAPWRSRPGDAGVDRAHRRGAARRLARDRGRGRVRRPRSGAARRWRHAAAAVYPRLARRPRALPDDVRAGRRLGGRADRRAALHAAPGRCPGRSRHRDRHARVARGPRHVPPGHARRPARAPHAPRVVQRAVRCASTHVGRRGRADDASSRSARRPCARSKPGPRAVRPKARPALFITPGYRFQVVDALLTNFHLPRSTLLMLVSAFAGRERVLAAYAAAIEARYRFYSFGDAALFL